MALRAPAAPYLFRIWDFGNVESRFLFGKAAHKPNRRDPMDLHDIAGIIRHLERYAEVDASGARVAKAKATAVSHTSPEFRSWIAGVRRAYDGVNEWRVSHSGVGNNAVTPALLTLMHVVFADWRVPAARVQGLKDDPRVATFDMRGPNAELRAKRDSERTTRARALDHGQFGGGQGRSSNLLDHIVSLRTSAFTGPGKGARPRGARPRGGARQQRQRQQRQARKQGQGQGQDPWANFLAPAEGAPGPSLIEL